MKKLTKKITMILGIMFGISGVLLALPAGANKNYLLLGLCLLLVLIGLILIAIAIE